MAGNVGRPRKNSPRRRGGTAREEILDAAAELFTTQGFATTSTHQIADAVGIRQASLYYYFPSKTEIFLTLLNSTVNPAVELAERFSTIGDLTPELRLWSLVAAETRLLLSQRWNIGKLYQLPVAASEDFAEFHAQRAGLRATFRQFSADITGAPLESALNDLPFHIALSVTDMRPNDGKAPFDPSGGAALPELAIMLADAALRVVGADLPADRADRCASLLDPHD